MPQSGGNGSPLKVYAVASQIAFIVVLPLLFFSMGGSWLVDRFGLPDFLKAVFVLVGVFLMIGCLISYLMKLAQMFGADSKEFQDEKYRKYKYDMKDYDFYDDNVKKRL